MRLFFFCSERSSGLDFNILEGEENKKNKNRRPFTCLLDLKTHFASFLSFTFQVFHFSNFKLKRRSSCFCVCRLFWQRDRVTLSQCFYKDKDL